MSMVIRSTFAVDHRYCDHCSTCGVIDSAVAPDLPIKN